MVKAGNDACFSAIMQNMVVDWYSSYYVKDLLLNFVASLHGTLFFGPPALPEGPINLVLPISLRIGLLIFSISWVTLGFNKDLKLMELIFRGKLSC